MCVWGGGGGGGVACPNVLSAQLLYGLCPIVIICRHTYLERFRLRACKEICCQLCEHYEHVGTMYPVHAGCFQMVPVLDD